MEQNNKNGFTYAYSAKERETVTKIREKYLPAEKREEDRMERLLRLDNRVTQKAQAVSLVFGVVGALVLGFGMSLIMSDLPSHLGITHSFSLIAGIVLGMAGGLLASFAYPVYQLVCRREREKIAPEILRLTDELMQ